MVQAFSLNVLNSQLPKRAKTVDVNNPPKKEISSIGRMIFRISNMFEQVDEL